MHPKHFIPHATCSTLHVPRAAGFTLIELLVSLGIIIMITTMVHPSKTQYERSLYLTNAAYDVALLIREAQVYSTNVRQTEASGTFDIGYGLGLDSTSKFTLFADLNRNHFYDAASDLAIRSYIITGGNVVSSWCLVYSLAPNLCVNSLYPPSITFMRPDSEACIRNTPGLSGDWRTADCIRTSTNNLPGIGYISEIRLNLASVDGHTKQVKVYTSGQISVQ
jgi:type II secretory pathway pseudopilin PulG